MGLKEENEALKTEFEALTAFVAGQAADIETLQQKSIANYKQGRADGLARGKAEGADALEAAIERAADMEQAFRAEQSVALQLMEQNADLQAELEGCQRGKA